jgi:hypothetical protein
VFNHCFKSWFYGKDLSHKDQQKETDLARIILGSLGVEFVKLKETLLDMLSWMRIYWCPI